MTTISKAACAAANSIAHYCSTRFFSHDGSPVPPVHPMLDIPWFADAIQKAIDANQVDVALTGPVARLIAFATTCKTRNGPEWMKQFADLINAALEAAGSDDRVAWPGKWSNEFHLISGG